MELDTDTLDYLFSLRRRGIKVGLHRTEALLSRCGNPHREVPVIHIAGTNGKGSTAAMIASILRQTGRRVGLYTSPHLVRFNERIRINGIPIGDENIINFLEKHRATIDTLGSTFFETTTALTFAYFAAEDVDVAILEVGMGGRLDSSNVANSAVSVLTPIDYDHMEFLGFDLPSIAREKCGILKPNVPVVVSAQSAEVLQIIEEAVSKNHTVSHYAPAFWPVSNVALSKDGSHFANNGVAVSMPLLGRHQITNAQTAITTCQIFDKTIDGKMIQEGLREVFWPARLQKMKNHPLVYYDVAHNPHGLKAVLSTLRELRQHGQIGAICALKKSKQVEDMAEVLGQDCGIAITTAPEYGDFFTPESLARQLINRDINALPASSLEKALDLCRDSTLGCRLWLIFGTHYIAEDVFHYFHFPFDNGQI